MGGTPTPEQLMALSPAYLAQDRSQVLFNVTTAFTVITTFVYILFLVSRVFCAERNKWEVWVFPAFAYIFNVGLWAISYLMIDRGGAGRHMAYWFLNNMGTIVNYLKLQTAAEFIYVMACLFPKLTILGLYLRIFTDRTMRICTWIVIGICIAHAVANVIASFTICQPFEYKWNKSINGHCANVIASYRYVSIPHILSDVAILILPISTLNQLLISKRRKVGIFLTFLMGSLGIITAIVRFVSFFTVDLESDLTWYSPDLFSYTIIEASAYLMCSCFPSFRPMVRLVYRWVRTRVDENYGPGTNKTSQSEITLKNLKGRHITSISASKNMSRRDDDDDLSHFIRLDESVDVDVSHHHGAHQV